MHARHEQHLHTWRGNGSHFGLFVAAIVLIIVCVTGTMWSYQHIKRNAPSRTDDASTDTSIDYDAARADDAESDFGDGTISSDDDDDLQDINPSDTPNPGTLEQRLTTYLDVSVPTSHMPGVAVAVITPTTTLYEKTYGDITSASSPVLLGSLSKSFTAVCIMQLVEQNLVQLDAPAAQYLLNPGRLPADITVRNLLNQTSGFGYYDSLAQAVRRPDLGDTYGTFSYANANYDILGCIVADVSGQTYAAYLEQHVIEPLGLTRTSADLRAKFSDGTSVSSSLVPGHRNWFGTYVADGFVHASSDASWGSASSGYIASSLSDMEKYLQMYLSQGESSETIVQAVPDETGEMDDQGEPDGSNETGETDASGETEDPTDESQLADTLVHKRILQPSSVQAMFSETAYDEESATSYGMGWTTFSWDTGEMVLSHDGSVEGYSTRMVLLPQRGIGIVVLSDGSDELAGSDLFFSMADGVVATVAGSQPDDLDDSWYVAQHVNNDAICAISLAVCLVPLVYVKQWRLYLARTHRTVFGTCARLVPFAIALLFILMWVPQWDMPLRDVMTFVPDVGAVFIACMFVLTAAGTRRIIMLLRVRRL